MSWKIANRTLQTRGKGSKTEGDFPALHRTLLASQPSYNDFYDLYLFLMRRDRSRGESRLRRIIVDTSNGRPSASELRSCRQRNCSDRSGGKG